MDTAHIECPYCGEPIEIAIDVSVTQQEYIEDCQVCCQPMALTVLVVSRDGRYESKVSARTGDD